MKIEKFILKPLDTNCYLLHENEKGIVIDPGGDISLLLDFISRTKIVITHILNTHLHFDHTLGNKKLKENTGAKILASKDDAYLLDTEVGKGGIFGLPHVHPFEFEGISEGEHTFLGQRCIVISTPGHTLGSLSFYFPEKDALFSGDVIFYRSIGRTDFPGGDFDTLKRTIKEKIYTLPDKTTIYPGHGPNTTIEEEKRNNPFIKI